MTTRLNIGCGTVCHPDWINLDIQPLVPHVRQWDVTLGLPCGDEEVDVCYSSHVVEHLRPADAEGLLRHCHRVLKDQGIIRIVVPDLEGIAREYVAALDRVDRGDALAPSDHEWMVIELLDQMVRGKSGGEMLRYLMSGTIPNEAFIKSRIGADAEDMMKRGPSASGSPLTAVSGGVGRRLRRALAQAGGIPRAARYLGKEFRVLICGTLLGKHGVAAIREALFRTSGECHRWMYDRVSLKRLFERSGFSQIRVCTAFESHIESFASYGLDVVRGQIRKPDSLYMEARK